MAISLSSRCKISRLKVFNSTKLLHSDHNRKHGISLDIFAMIIRLNIGCLVHFHLEINIAVELTSTNNDILSIVCYHCPNLKTLSLSAMDVCEESFRLSLPHSFPSGLSSLSLRCGNYIESPIKLAKLLKDAVNLKLFEIDEFRDYTPIFRTVSQHDIQFLSFQQCTNLGEENMKFIMENFPSVKDLRFINPHSVGGLGVNNVSFDLKSSSEKQYFELRSFKASQRESCTVSTLATTCGIFNVRFLDIMPCLEVLDLSWNRHQSDLITVIVRCCPLLKQLHLSGCELSLKQLRPLHLLPLLHHLDISFSLNTFYRNWESVIKLLVKIENLKYLDLRGTTIDDHGVLKLIEEHHSLECIDVTDAVAVSGVFMTAPGQYKNVTITNNPTRVFGGKSRVKCLKRETEDSQSWLKVCERNRGSFVLGNFWDAALKL